MKRIAIAVTFILAVLLSACNIEDQAGSYLGCVRHCQSQPGGTVEKCQSWCLP